MSDISAATITRAIHAHLDAKKSVATTHTELLRIAVEIGLPQEEAMKTNLLAFLDGFLQGAGVMPEYRRAV